MAWGWRQARCAWFGITVISLGLTGCGTAPINRAISLGDARRGPNAAAIAPAFGPDTSAVVVTAQALRSLVPSMRTNPENTDNNAPHGDPINVVVVATRLQLENSMKAASWVQPVPITVGSVVHMGWALARGTPYETAPVSDLYLFRRKQDLAWEANSPSIHQRDHCRAWASGLKGPNGEDIWMIAGTRDIGIEFSPLTHKITHKIAPDIDSEREMIIHSLMAVIPIKRHYKIAGVGDGREFSSTNGSGDPIHSDGMAAVLEL